MPRRARRAISAVVLIAIVMLVGSVVSTSGASFVGSTGNSGSRLSAGVVEMSIDGPVDALFDESGLGPGSDVSRCSVVLYSGTVDNVGVELLAEITGGTGLEDFVHVVIEAGSVEGDLDEECDGFEPAKTLFEGRLGLLTPTGDRRVLWVTQGEGERAAIRITMSILDDPEAVGRQVDFRLTWTAEP